MTNHCMQVEYSEQTLMAEVARYLNRPVRRSKLSWSQPSKGGCKTYPINEILKSGKFTAEERKQEYRRRGKSPSGVIDGEYYDEYLGNDEYNDTYRDWKADA